MSEWFETEAWIRISVDLLKDGDRTNERDPPNDIAVETFLRGDGNYAGR